jgi:hypothetical protein
MMCVCEERGGEEWGGGGEDIMAREGRHDRVRAHAKESRFTGTES